MRLTLYPVYDWCGVCLMDHDPLAEYPTFIQWLKENEIATYEHCTYLFVTPHSALKRIYAPTYSFMIERRHAPFVMLRWCDFCTVKDVEEMRQKVLEGADDDYLKKYLAIHDSVC